MSNCIDIEKDFWGYQIIHMELLNDIGGIYSEGGFCEKDIQITKKIDVIYYGNLALSIPHSNLNDYGNILRRV